MWQLHETNYVNFLNFEESLLFPRERASLSNKRPCDAAITRSRSVRRSVGPCRRSERRCTVVFLGHHRGMRIRKEAGKERRETLAHNHNEGRRGGRGKARAPALITSASYVKCMEGVSWLKNTRGRKGYMLSFVSLRQCIEIPLANLCGLVKRIQSFSHYLLQKLNYEFGKVSL